jgi:hypothetical protein
MFSKMNKREKELISRAAMDLESGNYLLYPRSYSELAMVDEVSAMLNTPEEKRTERQREIYEEYRLCTDYNYWKSKNKKDNEREF